MSRASLPAAVLTRLSHRFGMFCGIALAGVRITPAQGLWLTVALVAGSIPFSAIGLALGFAAGPNSAPGHISMLTAWTLVGAAAHRRLPSGRGQALRIVKGPLRCRS